MTTVTFSGPIFDLVDGVLRDAPEYRGFRAGAQSRAEFAAFVERGRTHPPARPPQRGRRAGRGRAGRRIDRRVALDACAVRAAGLRLRVPRRRDAKPVERARDVELLLGRGDRFPNSR